MKTHIVIVKHIKSEIIKSRYLIAKVANKELLYLYFRVGKLVSEKVTSEKWGSGSIEKLSTDLQAELRGLRGFSSTNIKRMKQFYEVWSPYNIISPLSTDQLENTSNKNETNPLLTTQFIEKFPLVSFTAHYEILSKIKLLDERIFYIINCAN